MHETRDRQLLERILRRDPVWGGYALGDLDDAFFPATRWFLSDPQGSGLLLLYAAGGHVTLLSFGEPEPVAGLVQSAELPPSFHLHCPVAHEAALRPLLSGTLGRYLRLGLHAGELREVPPVAGSEVVSLGPADQAAAEALYRHYPANWFDPARLAAGCYLGIRLDGELAAVGGTHVVSARTRVAALGDIVTAPAFRGRGLASALTHALCATLLERCGWIVLNVAEDNAPALRAYRKVGFAHERPHLEGFGLRRR